MSVIVIPPKPHATSPVFDETNLPDALRKEHRTKAGVWGVLRVLSGEVALIYGDTGQKVVLSAETPGLLSPRRPHRVEIIGPMRMQIEFYRDNPDFPKTKQGVAKP